MRNLALLTAPFLLAASVAAHAACVYPQAPQNFPNGATSTKEEMLTAQTAVKTYSTEVQEVYLGCLEKEKNDAIAALDSSDAEAYAKKKAAIEDMHAKKQTRRSTSWLRSLRTGATRSRRSTPRARSNARAARAAPSWH